MNKSSESLRSSTSSSNSNDTILELRNVTKSFSIPRARKHGVEQVAAVRDISFSLRCGEVFALVGESGSGKTTTGRMIAGLEYPDSGSIFFRGRDITRRSHSRVKPTEGLQLVFQDPFSALDPRNTVQRILTEPLAIANDLTVEERERQAVRALESVGMDSSFLRRYPQNLSGGQRQRVNIARALTVRPDLLICDEPLSALDVCVQAQILNLLRTLQAEMDLSILFISHDMRAVRFIADRVGVMCRGELVEIGSVDDVFTNPQAEYTTRLIAAIPR